MMSLNKPRDVESFQYLLSKYTGSLWWHIYSRRHFIFKVFWGGFNITQVNEWIVNGNYFTYFIF